jgi:membrane fusion protein, copper/silver efflux system
MTIASREALVDTGDVQYVFVEVESGRFQPRRVSVGASSGDEVAVLDGLAEGESVVTSGNFLLDSESRLRAVANEARKPRGGGTP